MNNLLPGQTALDRPDLTTRVFRMYLRQITDEIYKKKIFGRTVAHIQVIEFQKRGYPHAHIIIHLANDDKLQDGVDVDQLISAEIPDSTLNPTLHAIVIKQMMHGPCGDMNPNCPCMNADGTCSKHYPRSFADTTTVHEEGYPIYRRRDDGRTVTIGGHVLDNRWVVAYNPYLTQRFNCHINLEACMTIRAVKYLYKYVYKGHDEAMMRIRQYDDNHNEIDTYVAGRYVSAPEAFWHIHSFPMQDMSHTITRLAVHLENWQPVVFNEGHEGDEADNLENVLAARAEKDTTLTAWFKTNLDIPATRNLRYVDFVTYYRWDYNKCKWLRRQRRAKKPMLARMFSVSPRHPEQFHLGTLLLHVPGAQSYQDLRTINGIEYATFQEACTALGLTHDDQCWIHALQEAAEVAMPRQLRRMFAWMCIYCELGDPLGLWEAMKHHLIEDYRRRGFSEQLSTTMALGEIAYILRISNKALSDFYLPDVNVVAYQPPQQHVDIQQCRQQADHLRPTLNDQQLEAGETVLAAVESLQNGDAPVPRLFFVDGPGGSGKTYLYNYLTQEVLARSIKISCSAWVGIAATLLHCGRTIHSTFRLPVPMLEGKCCGIGPNDPDAESIRATSLFILDEASMISRPALEAIDVMMRDVCGIDVPFAGKVFLLGGDFRQTLPIVVGGGRAQTVDNCITRSHLWQLFTTFSLTRNMRVRANQDHFCEFLLGIGNGTIPVKETPPLQGCVQLDDRCCDFDNDDMSLVTAIFPGDLPAEEFTKRIIVTPTNKASLRINMAVLQQQPQAEEIFYSHDTATNGNGEEVDYPVEFLNAQTPSGLPPYELHLKEGCVVMLLRNLNTDQGLCNGSRLKVLGMSIHFLKCQILTGAHSGSIEFIPKFIMSPSNSILPFVLRRQQFPVRLAYSMTINKSQGQTFEKVGIYLEKPVFAHGQLYVALSRGRAFEDVHIKCKPTNHQGTCENHLYTENVVFPEVLLHN